MKPISRGLLGVAVGLGALVGGILMLRQGLANHDTLYQGRPIEYWRGQLTNRDATANAAATVVLRDVIIPHLTNQIFADTNDSRLRLFLVEQLDQLPGKPVDFTLADTRRSLAVGDLAALGPQAKAAVPALLAALKEKDDQLFGPVAGALAKIEADPELAIPALIRCLVTDDGRGRADVVEALEEYGPKAKAAVPALVKLLADRSSKDIIVAVPKALKRIDPEAAAKAGVK